VDAGAAVAANLLLIGGGEGVAPEVATGEAAGAQARVGLDEVLPGPGLTAWGRSMDWTRDPEPGGAVHAALDRAFQDWLLPGGRAAAQGTAFLAGLGAGLFEESAAVLGAVREPFPGTTFAIPDLHLGDALRDLLPPEVIPLGRAAPAPPGARGAVLPAPAARGGAEGPSSLGPGGEGFTLPSQEGEPPGPGLPEGMAAAWYLAVPDRLRLEAPDGARGEVQPWAALTAVLFAAGLGARPPSRRRGRLQHLGVEPVHHPEKERCDED
jgi:hypothetical protein